MPGRPPEGLLRGRSVELESLNELLTSVRRGESRALVVRGDAGVGKTALIESWLSSVPGFRVARAAGVQSEMELPFAGVHQLVGPMLDGLDELPAPQEEALRIAFGMSAGPPADRFLVGLAVLSLLSVVADEGPLLCVVDDAQWLDQASSQVLAFVGRRVLAESIGLVFAVREGVDVPALAGLPELTVRGLSDADSRSLLDRTIPGQIDARVVDRIIAETRGNPLALLELTQEREVGGSVDGFVRPDGRSLENRIERTFVDRIRSLPTDTQQLLLVAAAEPTGDPLLVWSAAELLGVSVDAANAAERADLIEFGSLVRFRHPLVRSAAYASAGTTARREAHRVLAAATDPEADPDRRAWHRASAAVGPDESVAAELERTAGRAQARGGIAAAAALLARAAELTPDAAERGARVFAAAQAMLDAGAPERAVSILNSAQLGPLSEIRRARVQWLHAQIAFALSRGSDAIPLLVGAAGRLIPLDVDLAREACLEALGAAMFAEQVDEGTDLVELARSIPLAVGRAKPHDVLLDAVAVRVADGVVTGAAPLKQAIAAFKVDDGGDPRVNHWLWLACRVAADLFDLETWDVLARRGVQLARERGELGVLPLAASYRAGVHMYSGEYALAETLMAESSSISEATGTAPLIATTPMLAAYRGDEALTMRLIAASRREAMERGQGMALSMIGCAQAVLCNGLSRYDDALDAAEMACKRPELSLHTPALVELVEAATRNDQPLIATAAFERLSERMQAAGTDWALGLEARSRALVANDPEPHFEESIERLGGARVPPHLARAQLLYGEWLRRQNRRVDARTQLRAAFDSFSYLGAEAFAERTRRELVATGEKARTRSGGGTELLTAQENHVARLAAAGQTNAQIGAELFISPRTVEFHLAKVFAKTDIKSRRDLGRVLERLDAAGYSTNPAAH